MRKPSFGKLAVLVAVLMVIGTATLAPTGFRGANLERASPLCLTCARTWLADAISNVALFVPLGAILVALGLRVRTGVALASLLSLVIETLQFVEIPPGRQASVTDWCTNSTGALIGALIVATAATWRRPSRTAARWLSAGWFIVAVGTLGASAWAVALDGVSAGSRDATRIAPSPLQHTPGFGWFGGETIDARVNGQHIAQRGTGPIIRAFRRTDSTVIETVERARDDGWVTVPIIWLHDSADAWPLVLMAERNRDVALFARLHSTHIGLTTPRLRLRNVFSADHNDRTSLVRLRAVVADGVLMLRGGPVADTTSSDTTSFTTNTLALSPIMGWSLIQSIVGYDSSLAPYFSALFLMICFAPGCWWLAAALGSRGAQVGGALLWSAAVLAAVFGLTVAFHVQPLTLAQAGFAMLVGVGASLAHHRPRAM